MDQSLVVDVDRERRDRVLAARGRHGQDRGVIAPPAELDPERGEVVADVRAEAVDDAGIREDGREPPVRGHGPSGPFVDRTHSSRRASRPQVPSEINLM